LERRTQQQIRQLQDRQKTTDSQLRTIQIVMKGLVTEFECAKLRGLAAEGPFMVRFHNDMLQELKRLEALRYAQPVAGYNIASMKERDGRADKFDLKQYIRITEEGSEYLKLREELLQHSS
jgi:hypothetical protein